MIFPYDLKDLNEGVNLVAYVTPNQIFLFYENFVESKHIYHSG